MQNDSIFIKGEMKEKIEKFSLKQQILKYPMQNIVRYIASESPESTQTPSHTMSVCLERAPLTAPSLSELADDIHTKCWLWITHIGILRLKLNTNTQIGPSVHY